MRLTDHLAKRRLIYPRAIPTLPDILMIDIPPDYARGALPLDRFYPVILETDEEHVEMSAFLEADRSHDIVPSLLDRRPTALKSEDIILARYAPPLEEWPWILLCCWPAVYTAMVPVGADYFARNAYTIEVFEAEDELAAAEEILLTNLGANQARLVRPSNLSMGTA